MCCATNPSCAEQQGCLSAPGEQTQRHRSCMLQRCSRSVLRCGLPFPETGSFDSLVPCNHLVSHCPGSQEAMDKAAKIPPKSPPRLSSLSHGWAVPGGAGASPQCTEDCRWCWRTREHQRGKSRGAQKRASEMLCPVLGPRGKDGLILASPPCCQAPAQRRCRTSSGHLLSEHPVPR